MPPQHSRNVSLTPELRRRIAEKVASGRYRSASEVVRAALLCLEETSGTSVGRDRGGPELDQADSHYRAIHEQAAVGIERVALDDGRLLDVNPALCRMLGYTREQLLSRTYLDITHPDDHAPEMAHVAGLIAGDCASYTIDKRYLHADGSSLWVRETSSLVRTPAGQQRYRISIVRAVTERKEAEAALRTSEALKTAILEAALDCIVTIDGQSRVVEWNPAAEQTFGYPRAAVLGRDLTELIVPPEYRERHRRGMARYLTTGYGPVLRKRIEVEAIRADGSRFPVELAISPIGLAGPSLFTAYLRDISARKAAEAALQESEARLRVTYEHAFVGIGEVDAQGRLLRVNEHLCAITGYNREELLTRSFMDITHPDDRDSDVEQFGRQMAGKVQAYTQEKRYIHKDGHAIWVEVYASTVDDRIGRPLYGVRVVRDISERKRAEEHRRLLVNELNHRVKNTLAVVQAIASQTLRDAESPRAAQEAPTARLVALTKAHDVLTNENWEGADLADVVESAIEAHRGRERHRIRANGPRIRVPPRIALSLSMALHELGTNAMKYGALSKRNGHVEIVWSMIRSQGSERICLRWHESGGPPVVPPTRKGFGSRLIERSLGHELGGKVQISYDPAGVVCVIEAPPFDFAETAAA